MVQATDTSYNPDNTACGCFILTALGLDQNDLAFFPLQDDTIMQDMQELHQKIEAISPDAPNRSQQLANSLNRLCNILRNHCSPEKQIQYYRQAMQLDPSLSVSYYNLSIVYEAQGNDDEAEKLILEAIKHDNSCADYHTQLCRIYCKQEKYDGALAKIQTAITLDNSNAVSHNQLGLIHAKLNHHDQAEQAFQTAIARDASNPLYHTNLGYLYFQQNRYQEALEKFLKAINMEITLKSVHAENLYYVGKTLCILQEYTDAEKYCQKAIKLDDSKAHYHNELGLLYMREGDTLSQQDFRALHELEPIFCYETTENYYKAEPAFQAAIDRDPSNPLYHANLGHWYFQQNRYEEALETFLRAIGLKDSTAETFYYLGKIYEKQYDYNQSEEAFEQAIAALNEAIARDPSNPKYQAYLGYLYFQKNRYKEALEKFLEAIDLGGTRAEYFYCVGKIYYASQRYDRAEKYFQKASESDPTNSRYGEMQKNSVIKGMEPKNKIQSYQTACAKNDDREFRRLYSEDEQLGFFSEFVTNHITIDSPENEFLLHIFTEDLVASPDESSCRKLANNALTILFSKLNFTKEKYDEITERSGNLATRLDVLCWSAMKLKETFPYKASEQQKGTTTTNTNTERDTTNVRFFDEAASRSLAESVAQNDAARPFS